MASNKMKGKETDKAEENRLRAIVFQSIECLLVPGLSKEIFIEKFPNLDVNSLADAVEERALSNLCGYPMCFNHLQRRNWSKYRIKGNKVYDTTERQRFCSDQCYQRYIHVSKQLPDEPLWFRGQTAIPVTFLEDKGKLERVGLPGREVVFEDEEVELAKELSRLSLQDTSAKAGTSHGTVSSQEIPHKEMKSVRFLTDVVKLNETEATPNSAGSTYSDDGKDDSSDDDGPLRRHVDYETSALGKWQPRDKNGKKTISNNPPRRSKLIDPLPLRPRNV